MKADDRGPTREATVYGVASAAVDNVFYGVSVHRTHQLVNRALTSQGRDQ